jgi:hypothetical protein
MHVTSTQFIGSCATAELDGGSAAAATRNAVKADADAAYR